MADKDKGRKRKQLTEYVCYVQSVVSIRCNVDNADQAKDFAVAEVKGKLDEIDSMQMAHVSQVAVQEAAEHDQEDNIENREAPWLDPSKGEGV